MPRCKHPKCDQEQLDGLDTCTDHAGDSNMSNSFSRKSPREGHVSGTALPGPQGVLRLVVAYLREIFPRQASPKQIAAAVPGATHAAVKKALQRDQQRGGAWTVRCDGGRYRAFVDSDLLRAVDIPDPEIHNLTIWAPLSPSQGRPTASADLGAGATERQMWWRGRRVTVRANLPRRKRRGSRGPHVQVMLGASSQPLGVQEFEAYWQWCSGILSSLGVDPDSPNVKVESVEHHCDVPLKRLALKGVQSMSVHGFRRGLLKVYNKRSLGMMRSEACLWPVDLHPREAISLHEEAFFRNARPQPSRRQEAPDHEWEMV